MRRHLLIILLLLTAECISLDVCNEINLAMNSQTNCIELPIDGRSRSLFPSFADNFFHVHTTVKRSTISVQLGNILLETDAVLFSHNNFTHCDGILPLGIYSPLWQTWEYIHFEVSHVHLMCYAESVASVFAASDNDIWTINNKNFTVVVNLAWNKTNSQLPISTNVSRKFVLEYPLLRNTTGIDLGTKKLDKIFSIEPNVLSDKVRLNLFGSHMFGVMVEGKTQRTRSYLLLTSVVDYWLLYFNLINSLAVLWFSGMFSYYRITVLRYAFPTMFSHMNNTVLTRYVRVVLNVIVWLLYFFMVFTNIKGLFWSEQLCLITSVCLTEDNVLLFSLFITIGTGILTLLYDFFTGINFNNMFFHGLSLSWVYFSMLPMTWSSNSMIIWLLVVTLLQIFLNYEFIAVCRYLSISKKKHRYITFALTCVYAALYNVATIILVLVPVSRLFFSELVYVRLWLSFYFFMFLVNLPIIFFVYARITLQIFVIKKNR